MDAPSQQRSPLAGVRYALVMRDFVMFTRMPGNGVSNVGERNKFIYMYMLKEAAWIWNFWNQMRSSYKSVMEIWSARIKFSELLFLTVIMYLFKCQIWDTIPNLNKNVNRIVKYENWHGWLFIINIFIVTNITTFP